MSSFITRLFAATTTIGIFIGFLTSCGERDPKKNSFLSNNKNIAIISMSGYATCVESEDYHNGQLGPMGSEFYQSALTFNDEITRQTGVAADMFASCYDRTRNLYASASKSPATSTLYNDQDYLKDLQQSLATYDDIYVVGHSYGGWLAMKFVEGWNGRNDVIRALHTLDPISRKLCYLNNPEYCRSAPKDILATGRQHIQDHTGIWINPWQTKTFFLHSSSIPQADENPYFDAEHYEIDSLPAVWDIIKHHIAH